MNYDATVQPRHLRVKLINDAVAGRFPADRFTHHPDLAATSS
jgi:hypothetical protein